MATQPETVLEPDLPIIDPHHHLWDRPARDVSTMNHDFERAIAEVNRYLLPELLADMNSGHNVLATVFIECGSMYRADGPAAMKPVGETEFVNGVAAMSASGRLWPGARLRRHRRPRRPDAGRRGGVRCSTPTSSPAAAASRASATVCRTTPTPVCSALSRAVRPVFSRKRSSARASPNFRSSACRSTPGCWSRSYPSWSNWRAISRKPQSSSTTSARRSAWGPMRAAARNALRSGAGQIGELAKLENVVVKLGGLAMCFPHFPSFMSDPPASSEQLAAEWRPYIETCIQAFGPKRCMFESNFPSISAAATTGPCGTPSRC